MSYRIVLIHGFHRSYKDMEPLEQNLKSLGYKVENLNFPLTSRYKIFKGDAKKIPA